MSKRSSYNDYKRFSRLIGMLLFAWSLTCLGTLLKTETQAAQRVGSPYLDQACGLEARQFSHGVWDGFLVRVIDPETHQVDLPYAKIQLQQLTGYLEQVAKISPKTQPQCFPSKQDQWAYWLNVYNAQALRLALMRFPAVNGMLALSEGQLEGMQHQGFWVGGQVDSLHNIWERELQPAVAYLGPEVFWCLSTHGGLEGRFIAPHAFVASQEGVGLRKQIKQHAKEVWLAVIQPQQEALVLPQSPLKVPAFWLAQSDWINAYLKAHPELGWSDFAAYAWHYVPSSVYKNRPRTAKTTWRVAPL